ncbi:MAG: acyltransferase [Moraxellaceae bacterium]|nr:acyltransferase [Moraxellaceae bacterium]MDZ4386022.1 acyltransferase [Moraxellaceae bacterium]
MLIEKIFKKILGMYIFFSKGGVAFARHCGVKVGDGCRIYTSSWGSEPFLITIGNKVTITSGVKILTHDGSTWLIHNEKGQRFQNYDTVNIGNNVFIGVNSIIMPGIKIGDNVIIGAGSVVTKNFPDGSIVAGNPAKVIGDFSDYEKKVKSNFVNDCELTNCSSYKERVYLALKLKKEK